MISQLPKGDALFVPALLDFEGCAVITSLAKPTPPKFADLTCDGRIARASGPRCAIEHIS